MMATGDVRNALEMLKRELPQSFFAKHRWEPERLEIGDPGAYMEIARFALLGYSRTVSTYVTKEGWILDADPDRKFMESVLRVLQHRFGQKPPLTADQFFSCGTSTFAEHKALMCRKLMSHCKILRQELTKEHPRPPSAKADRTRPGSSSEKQKVPGEPPGVVSSHGPPFTLSLASSGAKPGPRVARPAVPPALEGLLKNRRCSGGAAERRPCSARVFRETSPGLSLAAPAGGAHTSREPLAPKGDNGRLGTVGVSGEGTSDPACFAAAPAQTPPSRNEFLQLQTLVVALSARVAQLESCVMQLLAPTPNLVPALPVSTAPLPSGASLAAPVPPAVEPARGLGRAVEAIGATGAVGSGDTQERHGLHVVSISQACGGLATAITADSRMAAAVQHPLGASSTVLLSTAAASSSRPRPPSPSVSPPPAAAVGAAAPHENGVDKMIRDMHQRLKSRGLDLSMGAHGANPLRP
eukprot:RCo016556